MSLERLKKLTLKIALSAKALYIITFIAMICQTISFLWLSLMPNKLTSFFHFFRVWAPFVTDLNNIALCRFELAVGLIKCVFLFLIFLTAYNLFKKLSESLELGDTVRELRSLALIFLGESVAAPLIKTVAYYVYLKSSYPLGAVDAAPLAVALFLFYLAIFAQSKSVEK